MTAFVEPRVKHGAARVVPYHIRDQQFVLEQIATMYPSVVLGFKEYPNNSIDRRLPGQEVFIDIVIDRVLEQATIRDNSSGISIPSMEQIPASIGASAFRGELDRLSGKGFGMLAGLGTLRAERLQVYSRTADTERDTANYLLLPSLSSGAPPRVYPIAIEDSPFPTGNERGTHIVLEGLPSEILAQLAPEKLAAEFAQLYAPLLRNNTVRIGISNAKAGVIDHASHREVLALTFSGEKFYEETNTFGQDRMGNVRTVNILLYVNPETEDGRIGLYNSGMRVNETITVLPSLRNSAWTSGHVQGWVNANFLELTAPRTAVRPDSRTLGKLINYLERIGIERIIDEKLATISRSPTDRKMELERRTVQQAYDAVMVAWRNLELRVTMTRAQRQREATQEVDPTIPPMVVPPPDIPRPVAPKGGTPESAGERRPIAIEDLLATVPSSTPPRKPTPPPVPPRPTPSSPADVPEGTPVNTRPAEPTAQPAEQSGIDYTISPIVFSKPGDRQRSRLDPDLQVIQINRGHPDYQAAFSSRRDGAPVRYVGRLICDELAIVKADEVLTSGAVSGKDAARLSMGIAQDLFFRAFGEPEKRTRKR